MATVEIGYYRRHWVTFEIKDATADEIALLRQHEQSDYNQEAFDLLAGMEDAGRLTASDDSSDEVPEYFHESVEPNIISIEGG